MTPHKKTVIVDPAELKPYENNARTHSEAQVDQIIASINEWGWTNPVLITPENLIVAGHGRVMAAMKMGLQEVPAVIADGWTPDQVRAYVLADNQLAMNAGWDEDMLSVELKGLDAAGFDLGLIGFDDRQLVSFMATKTDGLTDPDEVLEPPAEPKTRPGDIWQLGNHRIICGDSTDADTVARLLGSVKPHLMVTDPPYGVEYDANWRNEKNRADGKPYGAIAVGKVENDDRADWTEAWALFPGDVAYVWHAGPRASEVQRSLEGAGFDIRCQIVWAKDRFAISRGHYHWQHEPCWYAVRGKGHWSGDRSQTTLWKIGHQKSETGHSTQKPIECMKRPIENNSQAGDAIYEPFSGSGTTIIAAEMTGRHCYAIELSPAYVDVAVKRWEAFTGREAVLLAD